MNNQKGLQSSSYYFNTERITKRQQEQERERKKLSQFEGALSLNISQVTDSQQSPYLKDNFQDVLQTVKKLKEEIEAFQIKIQTMEKTSFSSVDENLLSPINFIFISNLLHQFGYLKKSNISTVRELLHELRSNPNPVKQFQIEGVSQGRSPSKVEKYLEGLQLKSEKSSKKEKEKMKTSKTKQHKNRYECLKHKCSQERELVKEQLESQRQNQTRYVYEIRSIMEDRVQLCARKVKFQIHYSAIKAVSILKGKIVLLVEDMKFIATFREKAHFGMFIRRYELSKNIK